MDHQVHNMDGGLMIEHIICCGARCDVVFVKTRHNRKWCSKPCAQRHRDRKAEKSYVYARLGPFELECQNPGCDNIFIHSQASKKCCSDKCNNQRLYQMNKNADSKLWDERLLLVLLGMGCSDETLEEFGFEKVEG